MVMATVVDDREQSRFVVLGDAGEVAGFTQYRRRPGALSFTHTAIEPAYEGRGLGSVLVRHALEAALADGLSVLPFCPFVRGYIARHPEPYLALVPEDRRAQFSLPASGEGV
jgi:predicted GNAT family acetyltransferase